MNPALRTYYETYKYALPFVVLFLTSLFLPTATHRILFYLMSPLLIGMLWSFRAEVAPYLRTWSFGFMAAYLGYFFFTSLLSEEATLTKDLKLFKDILCIFVFCLSFAVFIPKVRLPDRLPLYFGGACLIWVIGVAAWYYGVGGRLLDVRLEGIGRYVNSIHLSFLMCMATIAMLSRERRFFCEDKIINITITLALLVFVGLSQTRSSYICLTACIVAMMFMGYARHALLLTVIGIVFACIGYFALYDAFMGIFSRLDSYRLDIWREALQGFAQKPLLGYGLFHDPEFQMQVKASKGGWESTHNTFVGSLFFGGLAGFVVYMALWVHMLRIGFSRFFAEKAGGTIQYRTLFCCMTLVFTFTLSIFNFAHYVENLSIHWLVFWVPFSIVWMIEVQSMRERHA